MLPLRFLTLSRVPNSIRPTHAQNIKITGANKRNIKHAIALSERVFKSSFLKENYMKEPGFKPSNFRLLFATTTTSAGPTKTGPPCRGRAPARPKNKLVSMACILPRTMHLDGFKLKLAGIGGVATSPESRGKGYAAAVMNETVGYMDKQGYCLSLLYPYKSEFYEQFGYRNITIPFKIIHTARIEKPECMYKIKKLTRPDYAGLKMVYDIFNSTLTGTIERPLPYWKNYCEYWVNQAKKMCWKEDPYFCAYNKGRMIAYIRVSSIRKTWEAKKHCLKISEFAALPDYEKAFECLLYAARKHTEKSGFKKLYFEDIRGIDIRGSRPASANEKREYLNLKHVKMYRICDFSALMSVLGKTFSYRLKKAGIKKRWHYFISIRRHVQNSKPQVLLNLKSSKRTLLLDEGGFIKLVLGLKTISNDAIARVLFPLLKPVYWDFDYL
jgi:GNAT superfamily N-acetyltransferase